MKPHAAKLSAPSTEITGYRPQRQLTGDASHTSRWRLGNSIAASTIDRPFLRSDNPSGEFVKEDA
jgi:hypothetical protein